LANPPLEQLYHQDRLTLIRQAQGLHHNIGEKVAMQGGKHLHCPLNGLQQRMAN
jgi:hypothetical protein